MPFKIKNYLIFLSRKITTEISFNIETKFEEWVKIFDNKEADLRHFEFDIKPLFRGLSKDDPKKVIFINQSSEGNIEKFFKQIVNGLKVTKIISQLWKNHPGYESLCCC